MEERVAQLERRVSELSARVAELEGKLARHRAAEPSPTPRVSAAVEETAPDAPAPALPDLKSIAPVVAQVGQSLLIVGGAFLIRALTDRSLLPPGLGVGLGILFATTWVGVAWQRAGRGNRLGATFLGLTAAVIGYPLVLESATRLALVSPPTAALMLGALTITLLAVAGHRRLRLVGWLAVFATAATAMVLIGATKGSPLWFAAVLVLVLATTLVLADGFGWPGPRWVAALVTDGVVMRDVVSAASQPETADRVGPALLLCALVVVLSLALAARRALLAFSAPDTSATPAPSLGAFEWVQVGLTIALGLWAAERARDLLPWAPPLAAGLALVVGAVAVIAGMRLSARSDESGAVWFHAAAGLELLLGGGVLLTTGASLGSVWAALAVGVAFLGRRLHPTILWAMAVALGWAAGASGGLLDLARLGLWATPDSPPRWPEAGVWVVSTLLLVTYLAMAVRSPTSKRGIVPLRATLLWLLWLAWVSALALAARFLAGDDGGRLALGRTLLLVLSAILLALASRAGAPAETGWLAWGALGAAGIKMLVQDLELGRPSTLFLAFLALGGGVLVLPKLVLRAPVPTP